MYMDLLIFTDLDGTLLKYSDYGIHEAGVPLEECRERGIPVIIATSKTRGEVVPLRARLRLSDPFIVENGAAALFPADSPVAAEAEDAAEDLGARVREVEGGAGGKETFLALVLGTPRSRLEDALGGLAEETGLPLRGMSSMDDGEVGRRLGLAVDEARRAADREFTEPFVVEDPGGGDEERRMEWLHRLREAAAARGLVVTLGDRLFSLQGLHHKGDAVRAVTAAYEAADGERPETIGLGDSYNDAEMLREVDTPVLVKRHDGTHARGISAPGLILTRGEGPEGWAEVMGPRLERRERGDSEPAGGF
ncbi:MAG: HAD hydrolase family protein [bacterium]